MNAQIIRVLCVAFMYLLIGAAQLRAEEAKPWLKPDPAALREAAAALATEFPPAAVRLYLRTLAAQDPETWSALAEIASGTGPS